MTICSTSVIKMRSLLAEASLPERSVALRANRITKALSQLKMSDRITIGLTRFP
ncbi:MAG: hypothetical protein F6K65_21440 [Moorea sp. SIO3C2]|nr:hypothetical protein [Moorena sp. SIO3C2]